MPFSFARLSAFAAAIAVGSPAMAGSVVGTPGVADGAAVMTQTESRPVSARSDLGAPIPMIGLAGMPRRGAAPIVTATVSKTVSAGPEERATTSSVDRSAGLKSLLDNLGN